LIQRLYRRLLSGRLAFSPKVGKFIMPKELIKKSACVSLRFKKAAINHREKSIRKVMRVLKIKNKILSLLFFLQLT
jgi:hypothetical protein